MNFIPYLFIFAFFTHIIAQYIHEFGHYISAYIYNLKPKIIYNNLYIPFGVLHFRTENKIKENIITISGILAGLIPIFLYRIVFNNWISDIYFIGIFIIYLHGCIYDFKDILNIEYKFTIDEGIL